MSYKIIFLLFFTSCLSNVSSKEVELVKVPDFPDFYADRAMYGYEGKRIFFERSLGQGYNIAYLHEDSSSIVDIEGVSFTPTDISFDDSVLIGNTYLPQGYIVKYNFLEHKLIELTGPNTPNNKYGGGAAGLKPFIDSSGTLIYYTMITNRLLNNIGGLVQMDINGSNWMEILRDESNRGPGDAKYNKQFNKILASDTIIKDNTEDLVVITYSNDLVKESEFNLFEILRKNKIQLSFPNGYDLYDSDHFLVLLGTYELYLINYKTQQAQVFIELEQGNTIRELPKRHPQKENVFLLTIATSYKKSIFEYDLNTKILTNIFTRL